MWAGSTQKLPSVQFVASKTAAKGIAPSTTRSLWVGGDDGGLFYGVTGAAAATYADDGGSFCGTQFIPTGGDGSAAWLRQEITEVDPIMFGAAFDGTDDSAEYQLALNSGYPVDCKGRASLISTALTVPVGVEFRGVNLTAGVAGMNVVLVNTLCSIKGKITGSGTVSIVERAVYPAASGVADVTLDVEVTNLTFGVQAAPLAGTAPKRWKGKVYAHDIVGTVAASEGYGVLLEGAEDCRLHVVATNIRRHAVYLSAGAQRNDVDLHVDGCGNYAVQMYSTSAQTETADNNVRIFGQNLTRDVVGQSGFVAMIQKANRNKVQLFVTGNATTDCAALIEGATGGPYPTSNKIIDGSISGQFVGTDVIKMLNADSSHIKNNTIEAYATFAVIGSKRTGTNGATHAGYIEGNLIDAQAQSIRGIYAECNVQPTFIGINDVRNNGAGTRVDDQTGGLRQGYTRRQVFSGTTGSIPAGSVGDIEVSIADVIAQAGRRASALITGASGSLLVNNGLLGTLTPSGDDKVKLRFFNAHSAAQTLDFEGVIEGD